ncbi:S-layer homology domain-containing protein [Paenibacillus silviterrae]|uniref:S-layer homology domain-containing protein n=1 Tax=Paenibacillus silviterrae TaxID=3242194 RepID=UPI002543A719|nr:S-layer homology domain-containing protein [Paenibacillus chinjuensis]
MNGVDRELLGVYRYDEANRIWVYVGGELDTIAQTAVFHPDRLGIFAVLEYNKSYEDVPESHWALRALQVMTAKHIIDGVTATSFQPDGKTTRAQFTAMLVRSLQLQHQEISVTRFEDVPAEAWYAKEIAAAYHAGLISGVTERSFDPNAEITREQMAVLLVRAHEYRNGEYSSGTNVLATYADQESVSAWAQEEVGKAIELGMLTGREDGQFDPASEALRSETAQALYRFLQKK